MTQEILTTSEAAAVEAKRKTESVVIDAEFSSGDLQPHDLALAFPAMDPPSFDELVEDIRLRGVLHPVVLHGGQILDGIHRWKACRQLGIECPTATFTGDDPVGFVVALNLRRRHLSTTQRSVIAARLTDGSHDPDQPAQICAPSVKEAAALLNVSPRSVTTAKAVLRDGTPEIVEAVKDGKMKLNAADKIIRREPTKPASQPQGPFTELRKLLKGTAMGRHWDNLDAMLEEAPECSEEWNTLLTNTVLHCLNLMRDHPDQNRGVRLLKDIKWELGVRLREIERTREEGAQ